jgi:hypothetical protein
MIGSLMCVMNCIRPDIAYLVSKLSRFTSNSSMNHCQVIKKKVLKYLRYTVDYGLHYTGYQIILERYNDINWIINIKDFKSTNGYVFTLGGTTVS